ncbi:hypothetical protein F4808DRAFT_409377 [Astrocystis sublimbata]|nr:hypothetical protein F4808DRAFT_409377 [Astrocystis sublimbata]
MHLHLSRLLLLTPVAHIQTVAKTSRHSKSPRDRSYSDAKRHVLSWAIRDPFKARLAVIHAGALFWHVRRYSRSSFLEPFAIYIATLVLWAYSTSSQSAKPQIGTLSPTEKTQQGPPRSSSDIDSDQDTNLELSFFYIDRPCDDEVVQTYLRVGNKLGAYMSRVGVISAAAAPRKIIQEGLGLLTCEPHYAGTEGQPSAGSEDRTDRHLWGIEESFIRLLEPLTEIPRCQVLLHQSEGI